MALFNYECDETKRIIDEVSPNYPQLTTYEKEWLYFYKYGYIPGIPVELEYETVSVNPYGMVTNAIPFRYKSAILKGNTLVNIKTKYNPSPTSGSWFIAAYDINTLKINTKYLIKVFNKTNIDVTFYVTAQTATGSEFEAKANSIGIGTITTKSEIVTDVLLRLRSSSEDVIGFDCDILLLEYQDGMEKWDIPYFEGMQSVKMPVLTTTGKNLFNINGEFITNSATYSINGNSLTVTGIWFARQVVDLKPNTTYTLSYEKAESDSGFIKTAIYTNGISNGVGQSATNKLTFKTPPSFKDISVIFFAEQGKNTNTVTYTNIQLEEGSVATPYEAFKSNILTTSEEVELRGIDDVKDELNLLTGELIQRVEEVVLDGSEVWSSNALLDNGIKVYMCQTYTNSKSTTNNVISGTIPFYPLDHLKGLSTLDNLPNAFLTSTTSTGKINIAFKTPFSGINQLKLWLSQNPITVQYQLETESIKTVDLTKLTKPYEGANHYQLTSNIPCEAILEVPVVSTGNQTLEEINNY